MKSFSLCEVEHLFELIWVWALPIGKMQNVVCVCVTVTGQVWFQACQLD